MKKKVLLFLFKILSDSRFVRNLYGQAVFCVKTEFTSEDSEINWLFNACTESSMKKQ